MQLERIALWCSARQTRKPPAMFERLREIPMQYAPAATADHRFGMQAKSIVRNMAQVRRRKPPSMAGRLLEQPQQVALQRFVAGEDVAFVEDIVTAIEVGYEAAGLAHEDNARGGIPG